MKLFKESYREDGFTLIEFVIAFFILSIFALMVGNLLGNISFTQEQSKVDTQAIWLAEEVAEHLKENRGRFAGDHHELIDYWEDGNWLTDAEYQDLADRGEGYTVSLNRQQVDDVAEGLWHISIQISQESTADDLFELDIILSDRLADWSAGDD